MGPFLIVEPERRVLGGAQRIGALRHLYVAGERPGPGVVARPLFGHGEVGLLVGQGLARPGVGLGVHVLVEGGELVKVAFLGARHVASGEASEHRLEDLLHVFEDAVEGYQRQVPARLMVDGDGIVQVVAVGQEGRAVVEVS